MGALRVFRAFFDCIERLININQGLKTVCVIGCGPNVKIRTHRVRH